MTRRPFVRCRLKPQLRTPISPLKSLGNDTFPVIFFIHGGGYQMGSAADYRCEPILRHFVSRRVIFVTANYRLGPLGKRLTINVKLIEEYQRGMVIKGFASTGDELALGNNGLWDLLMALKWVKENIHLFHGDPSRVTMMGHGSGASAASLLALSPRVESKSAPYAYVHCTCMFCIQYQSFILRRFRFLP